MIPVQNFDCAAAVSAEPEQPRARHRRSSSSPASQAVYDHTWLALAISLAAVGVVAKLILLPFPVATIGQFARWLLRLALVASPDVSFAAGLATACWLVSLAFGTWPAGAGRAWRRLAIGLFALCAVYAIASVPMFKVTKVPFTIRLLSFVGGPEGMFSSAGEYFSLGTFALIMAAPLLVVISPWVARRRGLARAFSALGPKGVAAMLALVALGGTLCQRYVQARPEWADPNRWERRIAQSPHWVLVASCLAELAKDRPFTQDFSFDEIDESDFRRQQSSGSSTAPLLPADRRPRNVILIVLESIGVEYFGVQGSRFPTTPNLDRLAAEEGVVFDNIYAQAASSCKSLMAISSSVYDRPDWLLIVRDHPEFDVPALPQVLKGHGYRTCYAHSGHWGWQRRDQFLKEHGVDQLARYLDAVSTADAKVAWLLDELRKRGLAESTLVAVTADHGESFGQHNQRTHSFGIYEQAVHVPLVLLHPGLMGFPRHEASLGRHIDVAPTLLDALNVPAPEAWQGQSLLRDHGERRAYFLSVGNEVVLGLRDGKHKYHFYVDTSHEELFNLEADPEELENLAEAEPQRVRGYRSRLGGWVSYQREFLAKHGVR